MHRATIRLRPLRVACSLRAVPNALLTRLLVRVPASRRAPPAVVAAAPVRLLLCRGGTPACRPPPPQSPSTPRGGHPLARRRESWRAFASAASSTTAEDAEQDQRKPVEPVKRQRFDMVYDHVTLTDDERELFKLLCATHPSISHHAPSHLARVYRLPVHNCTLCMLLCGEPSALARRAADPSRLGFVAVSELKHCDSAVRLDTNEHFGLSTTLRAAGGWVRDKLLGKQSDDVDIALDNMLGKDFAEKVS